MKIRILCIFFIFILVFMTGCVSRFLYRGDGKFFYNGVFNYSRKYVVDLGNVDLSKPGQYKYNLAGLPRATFVVGIEVKEDKTTTFNEPRPNHEVEVRMSLKSLSGETIIFEENSLNEWTWSYNTIDPISRLYRRGDSEDIEYANGTTDSKQLGVKASGGWGTYFHSQRFEEYSLELVVLESSQYIDRPAKLVVVGWRR